MTSAPETERRHSLERESDMIPPEPPPWVARSVGWLVIAIFFTALVASIVVRLPETVVCPFELVKDGTDAAPYARLSVSESSLGDLASGQRGRLFFEAFPYQRFGTITGGLDWIGPAAVPGPAGPRFIGRMSLDQNFMPVRGEARPLWIGMKGEARIAVGSRSLIEYAFDPIRQLRENMQP